MVVAGLVPRAAATAAVVRCGTGAKTRVVSCPRVLAWTWSLSMKTAHLPGWSWRGRSPDAAASLRFHGASTFGTPGCKDCSRHRSGVASASFPSACSQESFCWWIAAGSNQYDRSYRTC